MNGIAKYRASRVRSATSQEIVRLLYEEVIRRMDLAGQGESPILNLHRAREILIELESALDPSVDAEFAARMQYLYSWSQQELIAVGAAPTPEQLAPVRQVLASLLEAWLSLESQPPSP